MTIVRDFVATLEETGRVRVQQVVLFGSYARARAHRWSDIDLLVVSDDFATMTPLRRMRFIAQRTRRVDRRLQVLAHTPQELTEAGPASFLAHIKRTGVVAHKAA